MTPSKYSDLAKSLWAARTVADVDDLIQNSTKVYGGINLLPVGGRPNNAGIIEVSSDPALASVERITNAMDAVLEFHAAKGGDLPKSPREAAKKWLGIPSDGIKNLDNAQRRSIAENVSVTLCESGVPKHPTLIIQDKGIGIEAQDFLKTVLSLNEQNKSGKNYTMGTFGQGGSSTFVFAQATIIISRKQTSLRNGKNDEIAWTIVKRYFDLEKMKLQNYSYFVPLNSESVFTIPSEAMPEMDYGTRIVHIAYNLQGANSVYTVGAYQFYNSAVFDPLFPFLVGGEGKSYKATSDTTGDRVILGNATRLNSTDKAQSDLELVHHDEHEINLGKDYGLVKARYWVVSYPAGSDQKDPAASYVKAESAVSLTLFGQRQDQESRTWIKENSGLSFIHKNMVIQIEADGLTQLAKSQLFSSTRERARKTEIRQTIYDELAQRLRDDSELKRLNNIEKERVLQRSTGVASDKLKKRLNDFVTQRKLQTLMVQDNKKGSGNNSGTTTKSTPKPFPAGVIDQPRKTSDEDLPHIPTYIKFEKKQVRIEKGKQTNIWVEINAKNGFIQDNPDAIKIIWPTGGGKKIEVKSKSRLMGGKSQWYLSASEDTESADYSMTVSINTPTGEIQSTLVVQIVDPKIADKKEEQSGGTEANIDARFVYKEEWHLHENFGAKTVGYVVTDTESTTIFVNRNFYLLDRALSSSSLGEEVIKTRSERYLFPVACSLWLQDNLLTQTEEEKRPSDDFMGKQNEYMAEAVLAAMTADVDLAHLVENG
jgi:hypothetical protein